jgi:hypothetical protein
MLNEQVILTIAEAVLANTRILQSLVDALPREAQAEVHKQVVKSKPVKEVAQPAPAVVEPAPVVEAPAPVAAPAPVMPAVVQAVAANASPSPAPAPAMPAPPVFDAVPAPAPAPAAPTGLLKSPFKNKQDVNQYVLDRFREMGYEKGARINDIMKKMNHTNVNYIPESDYDMFYTEVEKLFAEVMASK